MLVLNLTIEIRACVEIMWFDISENIYIHKKKIYFIFLHELLYMWGVGILCVLREWKLSLYRIENSNETNLTKI